MEADVSGNSNGIFHLPSAACSSLWSPPDWSKADGRCVVPVRPEKKKLHLEETRMTWWALTKPKLWLVKRLTSWWSVKFSRLSQISDSSIAGRGELEILLLWGSWQEGSAGRAAKHTANRSGRRQIFSFQSRPWFNSCVLRLCYIRKYISSEKGEKKQYTSSDHWVAIQLNM